MLSNDGPIPTSASNSNRERGKDLEFFHTRVPAEVPAKNYPGSFCHIGRISPTAR